MTIPGKAFIGWRMSFWTRSWRTFFTARRTRKKRMFMSSPGADAGSGRR